MSPDLGALDGGALCFGSAGAGPLDSGLRPHPLVLVMPPPDRVAQDLVLDPSVKSVPKRWKNREGEGVRTDKQKSKSELNFTLRFLLVRECWGGGRLLAWLLCVLLRAVLGPLPNLAMLLCEQSTC